MSELDYVHLSASQIADLVQSREVTAREITRMALSRISATEPQANAFTHVDADLATRAADVIDVRIARGETVGPLAGVPVSVKDLTDVAGMPTTFGSKAFAGNGALEDAIPVARVRAAGGVIIGKTTTPEFGHKPITESPLFGRTPNPFNARFTSGGSSGGAGASLAWRQTPVSLGSDGGGSIRIPASISGLYGLKATLGRIPNPQAADLFATSSYIGPLARTLEDLRLIYGAMAGASDADPWAKSQNAPPGHKTGRIGYAMLVGNPAIDPEVAQAFTSIIERLARSGHDLVPVEIDFAAFEPAFLVLLETILARRLSAKIQENADDFDPTLLRTVERASAHTGTDVQLANERRTALFRRLEAIFSDVDFLVTPTLSAASLPIETNPHDRVWIDGTDCGRIRAAWYPYTFPMNLTGHPALSMPIGWTSDNLPIGLHISGRWYDEEGIFDLTAKISRETDFTLRHPQVHRKPATPAFDNHLR